QSSLGFHTLSQYRRACSTSSVTSSADGERSSTAFAPASHAHAFRSSRRRDFPALSQTSAALRRRSRSSSRSKTAVTRSVLLAQNGRSRLPRHRSPCFARSRLNDSLFFEYTSPSISKRKRMRGRGGSAG